MANVLDDDPIISRIKKLMNLAGGEGATEEERKSAISFAKALMSKYNIEEHQILTRSEDARRRAYDCVREAEIYSRAGKIDPQDVSLSRVAELLCDVRPFLRTRWGESARGTGTMLQVLVFIGLDRDVEIAKAVYLELLTTMRTMCRFRFPKTWRTMQHSYLPGFVQTLINRAEEERSATAVDGSEVTAIVLCKTKIIDEWIGDKLKITEGKARRSSRRTDWTAMGMGLADAKKVELPASPLRPTKKLGTQ